MKMNSIETEVEKIEIPLNLNERSKMGILKAQCEMSQQKKKRRWLSNRHILIASAVGLSVIFLTLNESGFATSIRGYFQDISDWKGTVVDTEYKQATEEIKVAAEKPIMESADAVIPLTITIANANKPPYSEIEALTINGVEIVGSSGEVIKGKFVNVQGDDDFTDIKENENLLTESKSERINERLFKGKLIIPRDALGRNKNIFLNVHSFRGHKKADAPLEITGYWKVNLFLDPNS